jgi:23S rRNA (adenine-N6)-dimethyltransferase
VAAALVADACVESADLVVEIGAGTGRLTTPLAQRAREVRAIELDPILAEGLRRRFHAQPNVTIVEGDALRVYLPSEEFRVVANVPFGCTGAILRRLLDDPLIPLSRADMIVEWGVALKRTACWPSTMLNVTRGAVYELVLARRLPARCFEPAPRVDAALLSIRRRAVPLVPAAEYDAFRALVTAGFRSGVRRAVAARLPRRRFVQVAHDLGFAPAAAARELDLHQWVGLHRAVRVMR